MTSGETVALFGSNGAGKTTLLRILAGLTRPNEGTVHIFGHKLPGDSDLRRKIGMVAHDSFVYGDLTASENLNYYARLYDIPRRERAAELLEAVALGGSTERPVRTFSRGMLQRLSLARAVLHEPRLLLLDEPFTGLDPAGAAVLATMLADLQSGGVAALLITHDFERGLQAADRAVLLHRGRVAWQSGATLPSAAEMNEIYSETVGAA